MGGNSQQALQPRLEYSSKSRLYSRFSDDDRIYVLDDEDFGLKEEEVYEDEDASDVEEVTECTTINNLPKGTNDGFYIVKTFTLQSKLFDMDVIGKLVDDDDIQRLDLNPHNISVPVALMMADPLEFPSISRARKACRKANIIIHRGPLRVDPDSGNETFDSTKCFRARVGDRVFPGDVLAKQVRMGEGYFPVMNHKKPPFELPVVFEDDHFAICNKPAGVVVYAQRGGGHGLMTIRAALPFVVAPPKVGTISTLRRPQPVHRLDKPTSGLLLVAKTKPAMVNLSTQFRDRTVKKTYTAVVNGIPLEPKETAITSRAAHAMGVDVDPNGKEDWQLIDHPLDEKHAVTIWRSLQYAKSLKAVDNYVTLVELKPKTGRYHQLRRHMAWVCERPIIGDTEYDGGGSAMQLRGNGLFLCSNRVTLQHPYYNTSAGRVEFDMMKKAGQPLPDGLWIADDGIVMITAAIPIPEKFNNLLRREEDRFNLLSDE